MFLPFIILVALPKGTSLFIFGAHFLSRNTVTSLGFCQIFRPPDFASRDYIVSYHKVLSNSYLSIHSDIIPTTVFPPIPTWAANRQFFPMTTATIMYLTVNFVPSCMIVSPKRPWWQWFCAYRHTVVMNNCSSTWAPPINPCSFLVGKSITSTMTAAAWMTTSESEEQYSPI